MEIKEALCFDDVLLVPKHSMIESRKDVSLKTSISGLELDFPIIAANMKICETSLAQAMSDFGGIGIIHRMCSISEQSEMISKVKGKVGAAIGIGSDSFSRAEACIAAGANLICIDVAHGHQVKVAHVAEKFCEKFKDFPLIVGNFANHPGGYFRDSPKTISLKFGIGGGSVCSTRIKTGVGIPTLQSILNARSFFKSNQDFIADGGIKNSGDIVKALAAGANAVMVGSLLAGTDEAAGNIIKDSKTNMMYKSYQGSASLEAKKSYTTCDYIEGVESLVPYKGPAAKVLQELKEGIQSGFSYCGASNIESLHLYSEFVKITQAGYRESVPHGLL